MEEQNKLQPTSTEIYSFLLDPKSRSNMPEIRKMIFWAEDTGFSEYQSRQLSKWLLNFAEEYRDHNKKENEGVVWSAIRTGASMLYPNDINRLEKLLEPGHLVETQLVTIKMIGRIFEPRLPKELDKYSEIAIKITKIVEPLLTEEQLDESSEKAALVQLSVYALVAMANQESYEIINKIRSLDIKWFKKQTVRKIKNLRDMWQKQSMTEDITIFLEMIIKKIGE